MPSSRDLAFTISDVARLLKTLANQRAARFGMTRAKWAVLSRLDRFEGIHQSELAEMLDLQPISLTRLLDGLCESRLVDRRPDPADRRANRLFLTPEARPLLKSLTDLGEELMEDALAGLGPAELDSLFVGLSLIKENLREALHKKEADTA
jgi:MarR family transcriptional regulator for hemolysin